MRKITKQYIDLFDKTLNLSGVNWWIIDFDENSDYYYCNELMKDTFSLDKSLQLHSIEETCPIAGDYNKNIELACKTNEHARVVIDEYKQLLSQEIDEYNNKFPYYNENLNKKFYFSSRAKVLETNDKNEVTIIYGIIEDITIKEIQKQEIQQYTDIIDKYVITSTIDLDGVILSVSSACSDISGYSREELVGCKHDILRHPDTTDEVYKKIWETIRSGKVWSGELKNRKKDGSYYWVYSIISPQFDEKNNINSYASIKQNISDKKIIEELSKRDKLTNLYNRAKLDEELTNEINSSNRYDTNLSMIMVDIDNFKSVNDTYGHLVGDSVLIQIARILKENIRESDTVGRWGGEEFVIICPNNDIHAAQKLAQKLRISIEDFEFDVVKKQTSSFGVSQLNKYDTIDSLIQRADKALYKAKESGRNRVELIIK